MESKDNNKRKYLRFTDEQNIAKFYLFKGNNPHFWGLIVNESYQGLAIVFSNPIDAEIGDKIYKIESESIHTEFEVIWKKELDKNIYFIGIDLSKSV